MSSPLLRPSRWPRPGMLGAADLAARLRVDSIRATTAAGSGHLTSSLSAADLIAVLACGHLRYDWAAPEHPGNDRLVFSKGHASPLLYALLAAAGAISDRELVSTYRRFGSRLQGHPTPALPWVDVATGSLGQGLPISVGIALAARDLQHLPMRVWVLCGDGELSEGSVWEAFDHAAQHRLTNLITIVDVNRLGQRGSTALGGDLDAYARRIEAFGCRAIRIDGHDLGAIDVALTQARRSDRPPVVLARTVKGKGIPEIEDRDGWHGRALPYLMAERAVRGLGGPRTGARLTGPGPLPVEVAPGRTVEGATPPVPTYRLGESVATRAAYGAALAALGARPDVVALDGEVSNSTGADRFAARYPNRYFAMHVAEQQLVAAAVGMSARGLRPFASTFAAFLSRAYDFIRMAAISGADIRLCGSHAGVEIGADGPSQMALEDIAAMRAIHGSTVLYPADGNACVHLVSEMLTTRGIVYLRTTRGEYPVVYDGSEQFPVGGSKTLAATDADDVTLVGAGVTVHTVLDAARQLQEFGVCARVIDLYSVKPMDTRTLAAAATATHGRIVTVEDHRPEGGIGSAVRDALAEHPGPLFVRTLAVHGMPGSGRPNELMSAAGIGADDVVRAARQLVLG